jgi:hypothetical protein
MMISFVGAKNYNSEMAGQKRPVLIACIRRDHVFDRQVEILESVYRYYKGTLKVSLVEESFISLFMDKHEIEGTPTFLFIEEGKERDRLLGRADRESLIDFLSVSPSSDGRNYSF